MIGRRRASSAKKALDYVWGYTIINDVSARDFRSSAAVDGGNRRRSRRSNFHRRSHRTFPRVLELKLWVNGKQMGQTHQTFIFDVRYIMSYLPG